MLQNKIITIKGYMKYLFRCTLLKLKQIKQFEINKNQTKLNNITIYYYCKSYNQ